MIHVALALFARQNLPAYEPDDGPLTDEQYKRIRELVPQTRFVSGKRSLF